MVYFVEILASERTVKMQQTSKKRRLNPQSENEQLIFDHSKQYFNVNFYILATKFCLICQYRFTKVRWFV